MTRTRRSAAAAYALFAALALASCGGDGDGDEPDRAAQQGHERTATAPAATPAPDPEATDRAPAPPPEDGAGSAPSSPEDAPGGAGDAEPARVEAEVRARGARLTPRRVEVPAYISVWLVLVSDDGRPHSVRVGDRSLAVGAGERARLVLDGLRPNDRYTVRPEGGGAPVTIAAVAEPGP